MDAGVTIPDLAVVIDGSTTHLRSFAGKALVLYFYPKDDTSGCTREAQDFSASYAEFRAAGIEVIGVSPDTEASHAKFRSKHGLSVPLAADPERTLIEAFGLWGEKKLYGRSYMGVERATFLFDGEGKLVREWRKVKVAGHAAAVLELARTLD